MVENQLVDINIYFCIILYTLHDEFVMEYNNFGVKSHGYSVLNFCIPYPYSTIEIPPISTWMVTQNDYDIRLLMELITCISTYSSTQQTDSNLTGTCMSKLTACVCPLQPETYQSVGNNSYSS